MGVCVFIYVIQCIAYFAGNRELISGMDMLYTKYTDIAAGKRSFQGNLHVFRKLANIMNFFFKR